MTARSAAPLRIGARTVGEGHPAFVIAEAGINHNGKLELAMQLVDVAAEAGADAVKFQTFNPDTLVTRAAAKARYQKSAEDDSQTFHALLKQLWLPDSAFEKLARHAQQRGIAFMSKGYYEELDLLVRLGVPALKIDSASIIYFSLLRKAAGFGLPIVLSTGGSTLGDVERALAEIAAVREVPVVLLHCTTAYPAPPEQMNLRAMRTLRQAFGLPVGLSDHSQGIEVALAAIAMGATILEKHFTLDRMLPGPDQKASLEPPELRALIEGIRKIEAALGDSTKRPTELELENMRTVRRSLVAERAIRAGETFGAQNVSFKRPSGGLGEELLEVVSGRVALRDIAEGEPITWAVIGGPARG